MEPNTLYVVLCYDGGNGWCHEGVAFGSVLLLSYPDAHSRNKDGIFELDEEGSTLAVSTQGKPFVPETDE